jgi:hypothetical protein
MSLQEIELGIHVAAAPGQRFKTRCSLPLLSLSRQTAAETAIELVPRTEEVRID